MNCVDISAKHVGCQGGKANFQVSFELPHLRYIDEFMALRCAPDILRLEIFPNAKEITESMGAYSAVRSWLRRQGQRNEPWLGCSDVVCFFPGDGVRPQTAALFAMRTQWQCYSIDPDLRVDEWKYKGIRRLHLRKEKEQSFCEEAAEISEQVKLTIIVGVHSHSLMNELWRIVDGPKLMIAMPCCQEQKKAGGRLPDHVHTDMGIWSPHRTVLFWEEK